MPRYRGTGTYLVAVLSRGIDGEYGDNLGPSLPDALANKYSDMATKTQDQVIAMLKAMTSEAGSDDLIWMGGIKVATPRVLFDPIASVGVGEPLVVTGKSNRKEGYIIIVACKGPVELAPHTVKVENDTFGCVFDTTTATTGEYIVKADDGDGHTDEVEVFITGKEMLKAEAAVEKVVADVEKVVEEILATPKPTPTPEPTPKPPGFEAIFAIAGLLAVAYLVHRRKN
jgi:PGF-CTERM protein